MEESVDSWNDCADCENGEEELDGINGDMRATSLLVGELSNDRTESSNEGFWIRNPVSVNSLESDKESVLMSFISAIGEPHAKVVGEGVC